MNNAVEKYSNVDPMFIDLRYDDKFILENINTKSCKISKKWGWKLTWYYDNDLVATFPSFNVNDTSSYIIKKWYQASQTQIKVYYKITGSSYNNYKWLSGMSKIPST